MADVTLTLRDVTASLNVLSENYPNPDDVVDEAAKAARRAVIYERIEMLKRQCELDSLSLGDSARAGHTMAVLRAGAIAFTVSPPPAFAGRTLRRYISGVLQEPAEVFGAGEGNRARYIERRQALMVNQELNPSNTFTDLPA